MIRRPRGVCAHGGFADCHLEGRAELQVESWVPVTVPVESDASLPAVWFLAQAPGCQLVPRNFREARRLCLMLLLCDFSSMDAVHPLHLYHLKALLIKIQSKVDQKGV